MAEEGVLLVRWLETSALIGCLSLFASGALEAGEIETVLLKDGQRVTGEILSEKATALYVDLGFDILRIPKDQVLRREKGVVTTAGPKVSARGNELDASGFFTTGLMKPSPVKELVNKFGEAVISIETPSGKGSGFLINAEGYAITNDHVVQGESRVSAILYINAPEGFSRRRIEDVEIVALNPFFDLALLKLPLPTDLKPSHVIWEARRHQCRRPGVRSRQSARVGTLGHTGDRQQSEPEPGGPALHPDRYGDQPW